jgi:glycosyltransferase involved in cell wall biosynthesis
MEAKISVIVPVYNVEKYLKRCVDSILNQIYKNLQIILVDDGSKDGSGKICDEYAKKDHRITVIHQENSGVSDARNAGLDISIGDYIGFIDSDDYVNERMYEELLKSSVEKQADIAICRYINFSGERVAIIEKSDDVKIVYTANQALENLHSSDGEVYMLIWNKLYRKELFNGLRYPSGKINEDEFVTYKVLSKANQIVMLQKALYYYYKNANSITTNNQYLLSKAAFEAFIERKHYFIERGNLKMIPLINKVYLNRAIQRYRLILESDKSKKEDLKVMHGIYKDYYKDKNNRAEGIGYKIFQYFPRTYFALVNMKKIFTHESFKLKKRI